ncbi:S1-like domain-containing RNA-binding protein [Bacillaceae bacterium S4-13-56]
MTLQVGTVENLIVKRKMESGYVLSDGETEVLLHHNEATESLEEGKEVDVFLYQDKKGQTVGTMAIPEIQFNIYDWAKVVEKVSNLGVFVNIGIQKEILVSKDDLPLYEEVWPIPGDELFVCLDIDKKGRLLAVPVNEEMINQERDHAQISILNKKIEGRVYRATKTGSFIITEQGIRGFIHPSERTREPRMGEWVSGRTIAVHEDGTINISLLPLKHERLYEDAETILSFIRENGGEMPLSDKSDPELINDFFQLSKSAFKRALGRLMKEGKVEQVNGKTILKNMK